MLPGFLFFLDASTMSKREQVGVVFLPHSQVINHCSLPSSHSGWLTLATGPEHSIKKTTTRFQHDSCALHILQSKINSPENLCSPLLFEDAIAFSSLPGRHEKAEFLGSWVEIGMYSISVCCMQVLSEALAILKQAMKDCGGDDLVGAATSNQNFNTILLTRLLTVEGIWEQGAKSRFGSQQGLLKR